jgi:adenosine deaminase
LHLHLEGAVAAATLTDLARKNGVTLGSGDPSALYDFVDLASFLQMYTHVCEAVRDADDFARIAYEALARVAASGGRYAEMFFSPDAHVGVAYGTMLDGILSGMRAAQVDHGIESLLIPAHNRELGPQSGMAFVEMVLADRREGVAGIGMDYLENDPRPFAAMYERARAGGLHRTAHAGETGPAAHVRDTIDFLNCERIDHGYHVVDDAALVGRCRADGTFFTCCPTTTTHTTIWRDLDAPDHAIRRMLGAGLALTINTDDPGLMQTTLVDEYRIFVERLGATPAQVKDVCLNGIRASWLDETSKQARLTAWSAEIDALMASAVPA